MDPLYLHIKHRVRIHGDLHGLGNIIAQAHFVLPLALPQGQQKCRIIPIGQQLLNMGRIVQPFRPNGIGNQAPQAGVRLRKEAPMGHAIGLIVELLGVHCVKVLQHRGFEDLCMELRHTVDAVGADDRQIRHMHLTVPENGRISQPLLPVRLGSVEGRTVPGRSISSMI